MADGKTVNTKISKMAFLFKFKWKKAFPHLTFLMAGLWPADESVNCQYEGKTGDVMPFFQSLRAFRVNSNYLCLCRHLIKASGRVAQGIFSIGLGHFIKTSNSFFNLP